MDFLRDRVLQDAIKAARLGREVLLHYFGRLRQVEHKANESLVSEADKESERAIFDYLKQRYPDHLFIGEESTQDLSIVRLQEGSYRWIVDPLDGTTNYVHGFPAFCVSIGFQYKGRAEIAVIDVPMMSEVYSAARGQGAFINGQALKVSQNTNLQDSLLATGFWYESEVQLQEQMRIFDKIVRKCRGIRRAGAAAYDLCLVARGVFDGYWEKGLKPWDSVAGQLLVEEAGGLVTTYRGKAFDPFDNSIIAGNPSIASHLCKEMQGLLSTDTN